MKLRIIPLGKGRLDPRSFSFQYLDKIHVAYARLGLFGIMLCFKDIDPVKDLQKMIETRENREAFFSMNRHDRRIATKLARIHARKA